MKTHKKLIHETIVYSVCGIILLSLIVSNVIAVSKTEKEAPTPEIPEFVKRQQKIRASVKEHLAYEAYEKRNAEITPWIKDDTSPKQGNAALLYYQAFILQPDLDWQASHKLEDVAWGKQQADKQVKTYMGHCLPAIEMAEIASRLPQCSWGIKYLQTHGYDKNFLSLSLYRLKTILMADAMILADEGHYRVALERCLTLRRFARQLSEDPKFINSANPEPAALRAIQHVLGMMTPDEEILIWFRGRLAIERGIELSFAEILQTEFKSYLNHVRTNPIPIIYMRNGLIENAENEQDKKNAQNLTDEQILSRALEPFPDFFDSIFRILDSEITYEHKCTRIQTLIDKLVEKEGTDPLVAHIIAFSGIETMIKYPSRHYPYYVGRQAHINGIKTAVEIYLLVAKTGQLPKTLPDGLPKDPFTGKDFIYEITDEGFAIRCQDEEFLRRKNKFLEFKVKK
jgi:hypothetical protein